MSRAQTESYTALKATGGNIPVIDGTIDAIWNQVAIVAVAKSPINPTYNTEPNPLPDDFKADFGMLWADEGMYYLIKIVDDILCYDDDPQWWHDDNVNILFSKDLTNTTFTELEFAWYPNRDEELKAISLRGIDPAYVAGKWNKDLNTYTLECFIDWRCFTTSPTPGGNMGVEIRARDDDDDGGHTYWESMFQWSTTNYEIENTGEGMGTVTLSTTEVTIPSSISEKESETSSLDVYPNPCMDNVLLTQRLDRPGRVCIDLYDIFGKKLAVLSDEYRKAGEQQISLDVRNISKGNYILRVKTDSGINTVSLVKI
jgi:hypothetical protein